MTEPRKRLTKKARKAQYLEAALPIAANSNWLTLDMEAVAEAAHSSRSNILRMFGSTQKFRAAVMDEAIKQNCLPVIAQGIAARHRKCLALPEAVKNKALETLIR